MRVLNPLLREPMVYFAALAAIVFAWYGMIAPPRQELTPGGQIVVDDGVLRRLVAEHTAVWRRPPRPSELDSKIEGYVKQEVLVRAALEMGLDRDDPVIRNRLALKMDVLLASTASAITPEAGALEEHLKKFPDRFVRPAAIGFDQVFLGEDPTEAGAEEARLVLAADPDPRDVGSQSLLPVSMPPTPVDIIGRTFGTEFAQSLPGLPLGLWAGPVRSAYGAHLVRVGTATQAVLPQLDEIREEVLRDWLQERRDELVAAQFEQLKQRFSITLPDTATRVEAIAQ